MSIPGKLNPNAATLSKLDEVLMSSRVQHSDAVPGRVNSSKRSTAPQISPCHYGTRSARLKETGVQRSSKKLDSDSEEVYTAPSKQDKQAQEDDDESIAVRPLSSRSRVRAEHLSPISVPSNNSAMGDYYRSSSKPAKVRNPIHRKYHRLLDERSLEARNVYLWRLALSVVLLGVLIFVIYRSLEAVWPKPKKTVLERAVDDLFAFFTL